MEVWYSGNDLSLTHCCPAFFFQVSAVGTVAVSTGTGTHFNLAALSAMDEIVSEFSGFTADHCMQRFQFKLRDRMGKTVITEAQFQQVTDTEKNKIMKINEHWEELREKSHANIQSERGILKWQTRSIQTEGHFGDIKENENFRRFNYRSADKVYKEFMLYAIGRNINKYCRFLNEKLKKFEGKTPKKTA